MFRHVRLLLFVTVAFVGGVVYERNAHRDRCLDAGGRVEMDLCEGWRK